MNEELKGMINQLAESLGVAASKVYEVMIRQTVVNGIVWSLIELFIVIFVPVLIYKVSRLVLRNWKKIYDNDFEDHVGWGGVIGGIILVVIFFVSLFSLPNDIMSIFNPEYYVIKEIVSLIKQ